MVAMAGVEVPVSDGPWAGHMHFVLGGNHVKPNLVLGNKTVRLPAIGQKVRCSGSHSLTVHVATDGDVWIAYTLTGLWIGPCFFDVTSGELDSIATAERWEIISD